MYNWQFHILPFNFIIFCNDTKSTPLSILDKSLKRGVCKRGKSARAKGNPTSRILKNIKIIVSVCGERKRLVAIYIIPNFKFRYNIRHDKNWIENLRKDLLNTI